MEDEKQKKKSLLQKGFRPFITGLLTIFPLTVTILIIIWFVNFLYGFMGPDSDFGMLLKEVGLNFVSSSTIAYLIGLSISIGVIFVLGLFVQAGLQQRMNMLAEKMISRIPFVKTIYDTSKKLTHLFEGKDQPDLKTMSPVICQLGGEGGTVVLALLTSQNIIRISERDYYSILIPTSPVPIGGAILYVPVEWVKKADIGIDGLLNICQWGLAGLSISRRSRHDDGQKTGVI